MPTRYARKFHTAATLKLIPAKLPREPINSSPSDSILTSWDFNISTSPRGGDWPGNFHSVNFRAQGSNVARRSPPIRKGKSRKLIRSIGILINADEIPNDENQLANSPGTIAMNIGGEIGTNIAVYRFGRIKLLIRVKSRLGETQKSDVRKFESVCVGQYLNYVVLHLYIY